MLLQVQVMHDLLVGRHGILDHDFLTVMHRGSALTFLLQFDSIRVVSWQSNDPSTPSTHTYDWLSYPSTEAEDTAKREAITTKNFIYIIYKNIL